MPPPFEWIWLLSRDGEAHIFDLSCERAAADLPREGAGGGTNCKSARIFATGTSADRGTGGRSGELGGAMGDSPIFAEASTSILPCCRLVFIWNLQGKLTARRGGHL